MGIKGCVGDMVHYYQEHEAPSGLYQRAGPQTATSENLVQNTGKLIKGTLYVKVDL